MGRSKKQQKTIDILERNVALCREFMNDWLLFNQILSAYPSPGVNKAQLENEFLKIKSKLAREHKVLREHLKGDYTIDGNTMNIVSGATNLEAIYSQSEVAVKKLQSEWHRAFISINETLGVIEDKKSRAEAGERILMEGDLARSSGMSPQAKKNLMIVVVVLIIIGVAMGVPQIRNLYMDSFRDLFGM
jgi:uncharacterized membrane protein